MMIDPLDEILQKALDNPTFENRQAAADAEIDNHGVWVGFSQAQYVWGVLIPQAA